MKKHLFALYQGDDFIDSGTAEQLGRKRGIQASTIKFMSTPAYLRRIKQRSYSVSPQYVIKLGEDDEDEQQ